MANKKGIFLTYRKNYGKSMCSFSMPLEMKGLFGYCGIDPFSSIVMHPVKTLRGRGYIDGETLVNANDQRELIVVSSWSNIDDWKTWYEKKDWEDLKNS